MQPKPLTVWYGGKARMAPIIAAKLPPHKIYVEPFGGVAGVLMAKEPSEIEVYNDLFDGIVTLFRVVRNPDQCRRLVELLELTPYARSEWRYCQKEWEQQADPVEKARMLYTLLAQNFVGQPKGGSWSFRGVTNGGNAAAIFYNKLSNIKLVSDRFRNVQIDCQPALQVCKRWDSLDTCIYLDPPYLPETRSGGANNYVHEMTEAQHTELLQWCLQAKSKIVLSGYPSKLYSQFLETKGSWVREDFEALATSALQSANNGLKGKPPELAKRTECLWFSPNAKPLTLWDYKEA